MKREEEDEDPINDPVFQPLCIPVIYMTIEEEMCSKKPFCQTLGKNETFCCFIDHTNKNRLNRCDGYFPEKKHMYSVMKTRKTYRGDRSVPYSVMRLRARHQKYVIRKHSKKNVMFS